MTRDLPQLLEAFPDLKEDEFYPGSKMRRRESHEERQKRIREERVARKEAEGWDAHPRNYTVNGVTQEFFTVGALAKAMNRDPVTIRAWIRKGWLPKARFQTPKIYGTRGDASRRLWTREQIEGIVRIAQEEGVLEGKIDKMDATHFVERIIVEFKTW